MLKLEILSECFGRKLRGKCFSAIVKIFGFMAHLAKVTLTTQLTRMTQMSMARVPLPTIVVVDSDKSAEDQLRTMVTLYRCSKPAGIE